MQRPSTSYGALDVSELDLEFTEEPTVTDNAKKGHQKSTFSSSAQAMLGMGKTKPTSGKADKEKLLPAGDTEEEFGKMMKSPAVQTRHLTSSQSDSQATSTASEQAQKVKQSKGRDNFLARVAEANLRLQQLSVDDKQVPISIQKPTIEVGEGSLDLSTLGRKQTTGRHGPSSRVPSKSQPSESKPLLAAKKPFDYWIELDNLVHATKKYIRDTKFAGYRYQLDECVATEFNQFTKGRKTALTSDEIDGILKIAMSNYSNQQRVSRKP